MIALLDEISGPTRQLSEYIAGAISGRFGMTCREGTPSFSGYSRGDVVRLSTATRPDGDRLCCIAWRRARSVGRRHPNSHLSGQCGARQWHAGACRRDRGLALAVTQHPGCAVIPAALASPSVLAPPARRFWLRWYSATTWQHASTIRSAPMPLPPPPAAPQRRWRIRRRRRRRGAARLRRREVRHLLSYCAQQASGIGCNVRDPEHIEKAFDFGGIRPNGVAAATWSRTASRVSTTCSLASEISSRPMRPNPILHSSPKRSGGFKILSTNIKKWSVGSPAQSALDALTCLMEGEKPAPDEIATIRFYCRPVRAHGRQCADAGRQCATSHGAAARRWRTDISIRCTTTIV